MFNFLGRLAVAHPWKVCTSWLLLALTLSAVAPAWQDQAQDDDVRFLPPKYASVRGYELLEQAFPKDICASKVVFTVERPDTPLTPSDFALVERMASDLQRLRQEEPALQITGVCSYRDPLVGGRLTSADRRCTLIQVALGTPYLALQTRATVDRAEERLRAVLDAAGPDAPRLHATGPAGVGRDLIRATAESIDHTTWATILLVVAVLLLIYRSPLLALVPLLTIGIAVWVTLKVLALVTLIPGVQLVNISQVFAVVILFGAGTDYCLFLISRYREELVDGQPGPRALQRGVRAVGGALVASAATVICGLGLMGFAEFGKIRCAGPVIALGLAIAVAASLTVTPALLRLLDRRAFWPYRVRKVVPGQGRPSYWEAISRRVVARPVAVWVVALAILVPLAVVGLRVQPTFKPVSDLPPHSGSVRGLDALERHFTAGETGPLTVLLAGDIDWDGPAGRELVNRLSRGFALLGNVAEVRSLTQPLGQPLVPHAPTPAPSGKPGFLQAIRKNVGDVVGQATARAARDHYIAAVPGGIARPRSVTRLDVVLRSDPFDAASIQTLEVIETWLREGLPPMAPALGAVVEAECFGTTVQTRDMALVVARDRWTVNLLVLTGTFLILLVLVRRLWLATYLLLTVLLSYYATLGLTALFVVATTGRPLGQVEWRVPFFLFTILVAVGEDYNILLVTRVLQERKRLGPRLGLQRALATTGGTITACGLIMAGTFGTLMLGELGTLVQIGFALAVGVVLDTFVVRPFLVPAFILLVWDDGTPDAPPVLPPAGTIAFPTPVRYRKSA